MLSTSLTLLYLTFHLRDFSFCLCRVCSAWRILDCAIFKSRPETNPAHDLESSDFLLDSNLFYPEFGLSMTYAGLINPTLKTYLVSLKYDFNKLKSVDKFHESVAKTKGVNISTLHVPHGQLEGHLFKLLSVAKWFQWLKISTTNHTFLYTELERYIA